MAESKNGSDLELPAEQLQCLSEIKRWIQTEAKFYGRTDDDFLLMFLRSCEFNVGLIKKTINNYYESRRAIPQWWANRNALDENIFPLLQLKRFTTVLERDEQNPTIVITISERTGENLGNFNEYIKLFTIYAEFILRRRNSQNNGVIWIVDVKNDKKWFLLQYFNPLVLKRAYFSFGKGLPHRLNKMIIVNTSFLVSTVLSFAFSLLSENEKSKVHCMGSDLSKLGDHVPMSIMPEEYGGGGGPLEQHDEAFLNEILAFNDYLRDDNKYGYPSD